MWLLTTSLARQHAQAVTVAYAPSSTLGQVTRKQNTAPRFLGDECDGADWHQAARAHAPDVLLLDNRDSFTHNIAQALAELGATVLVVETDAIAVEDAAQLQCLYPSIQLVVIGPGPRSPSDMPHLLDVTLALMQRSTCKVLGICLGLQAIVRALGGVVKRAIAPMHGKKAVIQHDKTGFFMGLPEEVWVMRYHSLVADVATLPQGLQITAKDEHGQIMAIADEKNKTWAVQFHPESIGTSGGYQMLRRALVWSGLSSQLLKNIDTRAGSIPAADAKGAKFVATRIVEEPASRTSPPASPHTSAHASPRTSPHVGWTNTRWST